MKAAQDRVRYFAYQATAAESARDTAAEATLWSSEVTVATRALIHLLQSNHRLDSDLAVALAIAGETELTLSRYFDRYTDRVRVSASTLAIALISELEHLSARTVDFNSELGLEVALDDVRHLHRELTGARDLNRELAGALNLDRGLDRAYDLAINLDRVLDRAYDLAVKLDPGPDLVFADPYQVYSGVATALLGMVAVLALTPSSNSDTPARRVSTRVDTLEDNDARALQIGLEPLLARLQQVLDDPPRHFTDELINTLESDRTILLASLRSPNPDPGTIERHVARVVDALRDNSEAAEALSTVFEAAGMTPGDAETATEGVLSAFEAATQLGVPDDAEDIATANEVLSELDEVSVLLEAVADALPAVDTEAVDEEDGRSDRERRIDEARLKGVEKFYGDLAPNLAADAIRKLGQVTVKAAGVAVTGIVVSQSSPILSAVVNLLKAVFR